MSKTKSFKVALFSKYSRLGASSRLRSMQFIPLLEDVNVLIDPFPLFDDQYLVSLYAGKKRSKKHIALAYFKRFISLFSSYKYDVVWIEYELFPYLPAWFEKLLKYCGVRYIVDYDDAIFHNYDLSSQYVIQKLLGKKIDAVMASAECVVVGNSYLGERAKAANAKRIEWLPTVVDKDRYHTVNSSGSLGELVIGWIGSPSTQKYIVELKPMLQKLCVEGSCKLILVGAQEDIVTELEGVNVSVLPWTEATEAEFISSFDIGIMPLHDGPWEKGKCGYKLIQYMACAKPVVASPVGVNIDIVQDNSCGLLAISLDEWEGQVRSLLNNADLRQTYGANGRKAVEEIYSLQAQTSKLESILRGCV